MLISLYFIPIIIIIIMTIGIAIIIRLLLLVIFCTIIIIFVYIIINMFIIFIIEILNHRTFDTLLLPILSLLASVTLIIIINKIRMKINQFRKAKT